MAEPIKSEQESFLEELNIKKEESNFDKPLTEQTEPEKVEDKKEETDEETKLNRQTRRRNEKEQQLREEALMYKTKYETLQEARDARQNAEEAEYLKLVERIYGTDSPEKREATEILKKGLQGVYESAKKDALEEFESRLTARSESESQAVAEEEKNLDGMMDALEEDRGADFSKDEVRNGFLALLEKMSPKDRDGNIIEYADPDAVWDVIETAQKAPSNSRAKELASRNMVRSGQSQPSKLEDDSAWRELKSLGIF